jgi:thiol-disulfide isomerase/thioredoxin
MSRMRVTSFAPLLLVLAAVAASASPPAPAQERAAFPDLNLIDAKGGVQSLQSTLGQATIINFWATWCGPCRVELPELQELYNELAGKGAVVLAVNVDSPREHVDPFMKRNKLSLPVYFLEPEVEANLGIRSLPTTVLLDAAGKVVDTWGGYSPDAMRDLRQQTETILAQAGKRGGK